MPAVGSVGMPGSTAGFFLRGRALRLGLGCFSSTASPAAPGGEADDLHLGRVDRREVDRVGQLEGLRLRFVLVFAHVRFPSCSNPRFNSPPFNSPRARASALRRNSEVREMPSASAASL